MKTISELPSSFKSYKYQQHRWSCGPANLMKKIGMDVLLNKVSTQFIFTINFLKSANIIFTITI